MTYASQGCKAPSQLDWPLPGSCRDPRENQRKATGAKLQSRRKTSVSRENGTCGMKMVLRSAAQRQTIESFRGRSALCSLDSDPSTERRSKGIVGCVFSSAATRRSAISKQVRARRNSLKRMPTGRHSNRVLTTYPAETENCKPRFFSSVVLK